ncbi:MAG: non-reducing end alpha-L-arabinofuranosidase family hydrolase [Polyangiaceae bacterium]
MSRGGSSSGGSSATGGSASGGTSARGGSSSTGGTTSTGGSSAGGTTSTGGGTTCPFPTSFKWSSTAALAEPKSPSGHTFVSLKDFTVTKSGSQFVVDASVYDTATRAYSGVNINFTDFAQMGAASQTYMGSTPTGATVAPTLFYFTPKKLWVLSYQWGFKYATTTDPTKPSTWSAPKALLNGGPSSDTGPIDQTVICDSATCYLFFAADNGSIYRSSMPIGNFPGTFSGYTTILTDTKANLFEAVQVYSVKGTGKYLMIVEAMGAGGRYFRALSATSLGGTFTPIPGASTEATPFAGKNNVTFTGTAWTSDISHGDLVRTD